MRFWSVLAVIMVLLAARPAVAQAPPPDALAAARELVVAAKLTDNLRKVLPGIVQRIKPIIVQGRPAVEKDFDAMIPKMLDIMQARAGEFSEMAALIYARHLSADDLRAMTAFYRTPAGMRILDKLAVITEETGLAGQRLGAAIGAEFAQQAAEELRKRGHDVKL